jgi:hypothetical protein
MISSAHTRITLATVGHEGSVRRNVKRAWTVLDPSANSISSPTRILWNHSSRQRRQSRYLHNPIGIR